MNSEYEQKIVDSIYTCIIITLKIRRTKYKTSNYKSTTNYNDIMNFVK
jgi:hypothetical protein